MKKTDLDHFMGKLLKSNINTDYPFTMKRSHKYLVSGVKVIDFGCGFKKGKCVRQQDNVGKCCCFPCAKEVGFLKRISFIEFDYYAKRWDPKLGFLGKRGCRLSPEMRSGTCLGFRCGYARIKRTTTVLEKAVINALLEGPT